MQMHQVRVIAYNALRIVAGLAFLTHGGQKLFGLFGAHAAITPLFHPAQFFAHFFPFGVAGILEFFGGTLMVLGLFSRPVAFVISGEMAVTYLWMHFGFGQRSIWWWSNHGELPLLYCYIWLFFFAHGPGGFSLDGWLARKRAATS
jgi:putative oxidoreductase